MIFWFYNHQLGVKCWPTWDYDFWNIAQNHGKPVLNFKFGGPSFGFCDLFEKLVHSKLRLSEKRMFYNGGHLVFCRIFVSWQLWAVLWNSVLKEEPYSWIVFHPMWPESKHCLPWQVIGCYLWYSEEVNHRARSVHLLPPSLENMAVNLFSYSTCKR